MSAFAVFLHEEHELSNDLLRERIVDNFPDDQHFQFSDNVYLVTGVNLVEQVTKLLGFDDDEDLAGAVLRLNGSFGGRSWNVLWDWLRAAEENR